jgi:hypothetical protein
MHTNGGHCFHIVSALHGSRYNGAGCLHDSCVINFHIILHASLRYVGPGFRLASGACQVLGHWCAAQTTPPPAKKKTFQELSLHIGCPVVRGASRWLLNAETRVQSRVNSCEIRGGLQRAG